jgi:L-ascorbate metabolism protein UlaG (beta-lactamase superfamily)
MYDGLLPRIQKIDLAFLPINGRDYFRNENDIIGNFDSVEAVTIAQKAKIKTLVPVHHDLYEVNRVNPAYFVDVLMNINPKQRYHIFAPAEKYVFMR